MSQRIKGEEVRLVVLGPAGDEVGLVVVQNFEFDIQMEIIEQGYLGEVANRFDDIFNGIAGNFEIHMESDEYFDFIQRVIDRAQRRTPASERFNAIGSFAFPDGTRRRILLQDLFFGASPVRMPSRKDYIGARVEFACSKGQFLSA